VDCYAGFLVYCTHLLVDHVRTASVLVDGWTGAWALVDGWTGAWVGKT